MIRTPLVSLCSRISEYSAQSIGVIGSYVNVDKCIADSANSPTLQHATLSLVPNVKCNKSYESNICVNRGVQDIMLCAGDPEGKMGTCQVS